MYAHRMTLMIDMRIIGLLYRVDVAIENRWVRGGGVHCDWCSASR